MKKSITGFTICGTGALCCILGMFLLLLGPDEGSKRTLRKGSSVCGLSAVSNICRMWGIPMELSEAYQRAGVPLDHKLGISLLGCKRTLESTGILCEALRFGSIGDLPEATPILLSLQGKDRIKDRFHAVAVIRHGNRILLVDGQKINIVSSEHIDKRSGNIAIVTNMKTNIN